MTLLYRFLEQYWLALEALCILGGMVTLFFCLDRRFLNQKPTRRLTVLTAALWILAFVFFTIGNFLF